MGKHSDIIISATDFDAFDSPNYPSLAKVGIDIEVKKKKVMTEI